MKRLLLLFTMLLCLHTAMAQQFKTSQGITTVTVVKPKSEPKAPKTKKENIFAKERGFEQLAEIGFIMGCDLDNYSLQAQYIAGYRFNKYLFLGGGTGLEMDLGAYCKAIPLYVHVCTHILHKSRWQPFLGLSIGALFGISPSNYKFDMEYLSERGIGGFDFYPKAGLNINPTLGCDYSISDKLSCYCNVGWTMRSLKDFNFQYNNPDIKAIKNRSEHCLTISLGFRF